MFSIDKLPRIVYALAHARKLRAVAPAVSAPWHTHLDDTTMTDFRKLLPVSRAAARLGITPATLRAWIARGTVPAVRPGRSIFIPISAIEALERGEIAQPCGASEPSNSIQPDTGRGVPSVAPAGPRPAPDGPSPPRGPGPGASFIS